MSSIVISCRLVQIQLRGTDLINEHKIAGVSLWIADGTGNAFREVGDIAGLDRYPLTAQVNLALAFETHHGSVSHVVIVEGTFLARRERQHVDALGLKTIPRPRDQPRTHIVGRDFDPVIQVSDRAVRADLVVTPKARAPLFVNNKNPPSASCYTATRVIDNSI